MDSKTANNLNTQLHEKTQLVNDTLSQLLADQTEIDYDLKEAIKYTLEAPGKRLRSVLVLLCCELVSSKVNHNAEIAAAQMLAENKDKITTVTRRNHYDDLGLMATLLRDATLMAEGADTSLLYNPDVASKLQPRAAASSPELLRKQTLSILETRENIERFVNPDLLISRLFLELCN